MMQAFATSHFPPVRTDMAPFAAGLAAPPAATAVLTGFIQLFPRRAPRPDTDLLLALASTMNRGNAGLPRDRVAALPSAGYTYLGQFIDHDLTADRRRFLATPREAPRNFQTPRFDLDSLYGGGPDSPTDGGIYEDDGVRLRLRADGNDFIRDGQGKALLPDAGARNDSNRVLAQTHLAFLRFHNAVAASLGGGKGRFKRARQIVLRHYQHLVLHDFLPTIVGQPLVDDLLGQDARRRRLRLWPRLSEPTIPLEYAAAAFRFGHSMVRPTYQLTQTGGEFMTFDASRPDDRDVDDLRGFRPFATDFDILWSLFYNFGAALTAQPAHPIDTWLVGSLFSMPSAVADDTDVDGRSLAYRNLHRGEIDLGLATGQDVVREMCHRQVPGVDPSQPGEVLQVLLPHVIPPAVSARTGIDDAALRDALNAACPLWYYVLAEAERLCEGARLGPVGGRLVAETMVGLMRDDPSSVVRTRWLPKAGQFGCQRDGEFRMVDLLRFGTPGVG